MAGPESVHTKIGAANRSLAPVKVCDFLPFFSEAVRIAIEVCALPSPHATIVRSRGEMFVKALFSGCDSCR